MPKSIIIRVIIITSYFRFTELICPIKPESKRDLETINNNELRITLKNVIG